MSIEELEDVLAEMDGECGDMYDGTITLNEERYRGYIQRIRDAVEISPEIPAMRKAHKAVDAALAAPLRNCDVGDAADWEKRFGEECDKGHICSDCPVRHAKTRMAIEFDKGARCEFVWAQMPYEKEGVTNGR